MPNLNMMDPGGKPPRPPVQPMMPARDAGGMKMVLMILAGVVALGALAFILNTTGIVHLWGTKPRPAPVQVVLPPVDLEPEPVAVPPVAETPAKPPEKRVHVPTGTGEYTIVIYSFKNRQLADAAANRWSNAGFAAMVSEHRVAGETWYRVSLGRYENRRTALQAAKEMEHMFHEAGYWIAKM